MSDREGTVRKREGYGMKLNSILLPPSSHVASTSLSLSGAEVKRRSDEKNCVLIFKDEKRC